MPRLVLSIVAFALLSFGARHASAYAWMIRHEITNCRTCHADPSGGGLLTGHGRFAGESKLRTPYGDKPTAEDRLGDFLFGIPLPQPLSLGGDVRYFGYSTKAGGAPAQRDNFFMQADVAGQIKVDRFRANASVGYADEGAFAASLTRASEHNLISRVHWIGVDLGERDELLLRGGRINLPFGIRSIEHTLWVRQATRTDINDSQEDGIALAYSHGRWRAEIMAILGNYQVRPDTFRERGYSGYVEYAPIRTLAFGASSLVTHANTDVQLQTEVIRQEHGVFGRYSPLRPLVISAEGDFTFTSQPATAQQAAINTPGFVSMVQTDVEPLQGLHAILTGELWAQKSDAKFPSIGGWASLAWFFAPHSDVRLDAIYQSLPQAGARLPVTTLVLQGHVYL